MITFLKNVISRVENSKKPLVYFILTFFFATTLRNFLEVFSTRLEIPLEYFVHYYLSYISLALAIILLFYLVTREKIDKLAKVILPSFLVLVLVPIIDLIFLIFSGQVYRITYMISGGYNLLLRFFTFFGSFSGFGITPGMRIEIALILIISFFYFKIKTKSVLKSLLSSFLLYTLIFIYCAMPFVVKSLLAISNIFTELSNRLMINFYLLLIFVLLLVIFWLRNRSYLVNLLKDIRPFRLLHFELMFIFGIVLTKVLWKTDLIFLLKRENIFHFIFILISIMLAWLFSVIFNNLEDVDIDKITNRLRPSVINSIPSKAYKLIGLIALFLAVIFSLAVNFWIFFLILCFVGNYFFYSMPPLRLKRIPVFSKLMIAFSSLLLVILGFIFAGGNLLEFPPMFTLSFLIFLTLVINFIDIKDYRGDKKAGIKTLPVILGLKKSKLLIGSFFLIPAVIIPIFWQKFFLLIPALIFAGGEFILINKKNYQEKWVFSLHLTGLIILLVYLMVH